MATIRKLVFRDGEIYHVFNRGMDRRTTFTEKREFERMQKLIRFYRHKDIPIRFSKVIQQPEDTREKILGALYQGEKVVDILSYCLMPNHFHFLLKQKTEKGIPSFISNITNAYTKYFNTKHERTGPLLEGVFKAVHIESDEQLVHVSRYIHLNPVVSGVIAENELENYQWASYPEYLSLSNMEISQKDLILDMFKTVKVYREFVNNQIDYGKQLEVIKHLILE
ncbi:MAG: transposase [Candidatus Daviesbacteria bacterium]|nr:transposase [Candidatus Daviesbacteria bacterium]